MRTKMMAAMTAMLALCAQGTAAHTQQWYAEHIAEAKAMEASCLKRLKANEQLTSEEMAECRRAGSAIARSGKYEVKTPARTWW
ncbi:hypothetical protein LJR290_007918 [Variovorax sp. LjRoot290]|uniref:hypothetical protein n=1 Tax=Variovorax sp. LjRoot290 TaxID=3342316 RepID=UPI003ECD5F7C